MRLIASPAWQYPVYASLALAPSTAGCGTLDPQQALGESDAMKQAIGLAAMERFRKRYSSSPEHHLKPPLTSQVALAVVAVGVIFTILASILIIFDFAGFVLAGWQ